MLLLNKALVSSPANTALSQRRHIPRHGRNIPHLSPSLARNTRLVNRASQRFKRLECQAVSLGAGGKSQSEQRNGPESTAPMLLNAALRALCHKEGSRLIFGLDINNAIKHHSEDPNASALKIQSRNNHHNTHEPPSTKFHLYSALSNTRGGTEIAKPFLGCGLPARIGSLSYRRGL
eukprot:8483394-Pyramimonas_sp.AAC.1